jgi:predicted PhzF superfamily epimerase YddE/YHI9
MPRIPLCQVDAFADAPFAGDPAAACRLESWPDDATPRAIAAENTLAETAFLARTAIGGRRTLYLEGAISV